jgi:hypothetical protein
MIGRVALLITFKKAKPKSQSLSRSHIRDLYAIMKLVKRITLFTVFLLGSLMPFIPRFHTIVAFSLVIPLLVLFGGSLIYFVWSLFDRSLRHAGFALVVVPLFFGSSVAASAGVGTVQKFRAKLYISKIESFKSINGNYPFEYPTSFGIQYSSYLNEENERDRFSLKFNRGFFVREFYDSSEKEWTSFGWGD